MEELYEFSEHLNNSHFSELQSSVIFRSSQKIEEKTTAVSLKVGTVLFS